MNAEALPPPATVTGQIAGGAAVIAHLREVAPLREVECRTLGAGIELRYDGSTARVALEGDRAVLRLAARDAAALHVMREVTAYLLDAAGDRVIWDALLPEGMLAPNLRLVEIVSVTPISPGFRRVRVAGDVARFAGPGLHLRLLLPPEGRAPLWPRIDATGRTRWPEGEAKLHCPAYTLRRLDAAAGWLEFDLFRHEGGQATGWCDRVQPGTRVGLIGPGGGGVPEAGWVALFGDETALPAIARILETLPTTTRGAATIRIANPADCQALVRPAGVTLNWMTRGDRGGLLEALDRLTLPPPEASRFVWFAAEEAEASAARARMRARGLARGEMLAAGYWSA